MTLTDVQAAARKAADYGIAALSGEKGPTYDSLVYSGALVMAHLGRAKDIAEGGEQLRAALDSGKAAERVR